MNIITLSVFTVLLYAGTSLTQGLSLVSRRQGVRFWILVFGFLAIVLHGVLLYCWIDLPSGQNLTASNMLSLITWLISLLILSVALFKPVEILVVFIFPAAVLSILLVLGFPSRFIITTRANLTELFHIVLSVITFAILCVAGLQAVLLAIQERTLRSKPAGTFIHKLPPLITMEKFLFQMIGVGFAFLSLLLVTSIYFFHSKMLHDIFLFQKTTLVISAWIIFAILLLGRYLRGWRGRKAVYCTLYGVLLLLIVYFGSKLIG